MARLELLAGRRTAIMLYSNFSRVITTKFMPLTCPEAVPRLLRTFPDSDNGAPNWSRDGKWI